jgi:hypothetical protein
MSTIRLEYHEIREVFERHNERMNSAVAAELADLSLAKYRAAVAPTTGSAPVALGELAGWCFPSGGRTRFADQGDTVDLSLKDVMRPVYYAAPASPAATTGSAPEKHSSGCQCPACNWERSNPEIAITASPAASVLTDEQVQAARIEWFSDKWNECEFENVDDYFNTRMRAALLAASMGGDAK